MFIKENTLYENERAEKTSCFGVRGVFISGAIK
jgi:hypothetical protein